jgi:hypothetical protein
VAGVGFEGGHEGAAVEADAGAGVLRGEADGDEAGDAVGAAGRCATTSAMKGCQLRMPDVDAERMAGGGERLPRAVGLGEGPAGERRSFGAGRFAETDLGVAVLQLFDDLVREGAAAGDLGEVFGHLAEDVGGSVGEKKDGCGRALPSSSREAMRWSRSWRKKMVAGTMRNMTPPQAPAVHMKGMLARNPAVGPLMM